MSDFLEQWSRQRRKPSNLSSFAVDHDKWDRADYERLLKEIETLNVSEGRIQEKIPTGEPLFADTFFALVKSDPKLRGPGEVRPSHLVNRAIMQEAMGLKEYEELRISSTGDEIGSALACIAMEPELETIWDKFKTETQLAKSLAQKQSALDAAHESVDELMSELENFDPDDPNNEQQVKDFQSQLDGLNAQIQALMEAIAEQAEQLQDMLDQSAPLMAAELKQALQIGNQELQNLQTLDLAWGLQPGQLQRLPAEERIALAARLNNQRIRDIADLIGPMKRLAFAEQQRKTIDARDEIYSIGLGDDLSRTLPIEFMTLHHPMRRYDFYRKYIEKSLSVYKMRGTERVAKGGIFLCEDGSGSMSGKPERWAKAVSICLLNIARAQKRSFYGVHFGGPGEIYCHDFRDPSCVTLDDVLSWAEEFSGGGTDFMTPLSHCLNLLKEEHETFGAVRGDIVFVTDGQCGVDPTWLEKFQEEKKRLDFRVFGVIIGGTKQDEPLASICDGRVWTVSDFYTGDDVRDIFRFV